MNEILVRNSSLTDVDVRQRIIELLAVPYDEEAEVLWRGEVWREVHRRGAYDGIEAHAGRVRVNREHVRGRTVGKVVHFAPDDNMGLRTRVKIAETPRGDETLALADEDMISPSVGFFTKVPSDTILNKRTRLREVVRGFIDHLGMVESPAYQGAQVLEVREEPSGLTVAESPLPATPAIDEAMNNPMFAWARDRLAAGE